MPEQFDPNGLNRLLQPGVLGLYQSMEVTTITLTQISTKQIFNLLTVIVAQDCSGIHDRTIKFVCPRINVPGLAGLSFGISQHELSLSEVVSELELTTTEQKWGTLIFGKLNFRGHWFAPANGAGDNIALNSVLKNNFWNGSHVWEWTDVDKSPFRPLLEKPQLLQALSQIVSSRLPIHIAGVSDRLGGVIVQLPVKALQMTYRGRGNKGGGATAQLNWLDGITPRSVVISLTREHDGLFAEAAATTISSSPVELIIPDAPGMQFANVKDAVTGDVLGRHSLIFLRSIGLRMGIQHPQKRVFTIPGPGGPTTNEVEVAGTEESEVGNSKSLSHFSDTANRIYRAEMSDLRERLELVQYLPDPQKSKNLRHEEALVDLRKLINSHGRHGVWLWDPFLASVDVLETLFFNSHMKSQMRAISGGRVIESAAPAVGAQSPTTVTDFVKEQRSIMQQNAGGNQGLNLEFRARSDSAGWPFHDRFIIFSKPDGATLAWSLGTSVNSLGMQHHILQKVPDGRLIADAFDELWGQLNGQQHLIWKAS